MKQYIDVAKLNELRIMRAENAVFADRDYREPVLLKSPQQAEEEAAEAQKKRNLVDGIFAQLKPPGLTQAPLQPPSLELVTTTE